MSGEQGGWAKLAARVLNRPVEVERREADWVFNFGDGFGICVECSWRLRDPNLILLTDTDEGQRFGLSEPIDAATRANALVGGDHVSDFNPDPATGDFRLLFSKGIILEVLSNSSGFESWQAYDGDNLVAVGAGGGLR